MSGSLPVRVTPPGFFKRWTCSLTVISPTIVLYRLFLILNLKRRRQKLEVKLIDILAPKFDFVCTQVHSNDWPPLYKSDIKPTRFFFALTNVHATFCCRRAATCRWFRTAPTSSLAPARTRIHVTNENVAGRKVWGERKGACGEPHYGWGCGACAVVHHRERGCDCQFWTKRWSLPPARLWQIQRNQTTERAYKSIEFVCQYATTIASEGGAKVRKRV